MFRLFFRSAKRLIDWYYDFEVPEVYERRSLILKECELSLLQRERHQLLRRRPDGLISWIKYHRALRPRLTGTRTPALLFAFYMVILYLWVDLYHHPFELKLFSLMPLLLFGLWFFIVDRTKISFNVRSSELTDEFVYEEDYLNNLDLVILVRDCTESIEFINREEKLFWNKWVLNPIKVFSGILGSWFLGKFLEIYIEPSSTEFSKLYQIFLIPIKNSRLYYLLMILSTLLILIYIERYSVPRCRLKRVRSTLRQKRTDIS
jgi:hypothetical protein